MSGDALRSALRGLNRPHIRRQKPGYAETYYDLAEHLEDYAAAVIGQLHLSPHSVIGGPGETGATLKVLSGTSAVIIKIGIWDGELFTSNAFYRKLHKTDVPVLEVLHYDDSKRVIPYEFQVLEFLDGVDVQHLCP